MSVARSEALAGIWPQRIDTTAETLPESQGKETYIEGDEVMTKADRDQIAEEIASRLTQPSGSSGAWSRTFVTIAVVMIGWIFTALYIAKTTETEIRVSNAILTEQLKETREQFIEYKRATERDLRVADEHYRELSIAVQSQHHK